MSEIQYCQSVMQQQEYLFKSDLNKYLLYEPETGNIFWKKSTGRALAGTQAGHIHVSGYKKLSFQGRGYFLHRLAWLFVHGDFPMHSIDHIDGDKSNNKINNLRIATTRENLQNLKHARSDNESGFLGVGYHKASGLFRARITNDGRQKHLGLFKTPVAAYEAYLREKRKVHEFCTI